MKEKLVYFPKNKQELIDIIKKLFKNKIYNLNCIDTSNIIDMSYLFRSIYQDINGGIVDHSFDVSEWDVSNVTNMEGIFNNCNVFDCDFSKWNTSNVENLNFAFHKCYNFKGNGLDNWNISNVKKMDFIFYECKNFTGKTIENWNTLNIEHAWYAFAYCNNFNANLYKWKINNCEFIGGMFFNCIKFEGNGLENWNTSKIKSMSDIFNNCPKLKCNLSKWDVSNVTHMEGMFCGCSNIKCDLSNWNVSKCENFENMFEGCNIDNLNIDNWNVNPTSKTRGIFFNIKIPNHFPNWYLNRQIIIRFI